MADTPEQPEGQTRSQPDMEIVVRGPRNSTPHVSHVADAPALDRGAEIVELLQKLQQGMDEIRNEISRNDRNAVARVTNSNASFDWACLEPFYGTNGELIPGFPRNPGEVRDLGSNGVDSLLLALGLEVGGSLRDRMDRFKRYIGLRFC